MHLILLSPDYCKKGKMESLIESHIPAVLSELHDLSLHDKPTGRKAFRDIKNYSLKRSIFLELCLFINKYNI